ncbi:hypothetical protein NRY68_15785 [Acidithiobacillus ferrooxidans]|jgi:hypothetical protein|uniref:hypothetical protein n=1 Tax=Acidithiobacillus ferrooxidans TaxID=920 RepID=UPI0021474D52|nr:hypothetical protein [Acidithiobacillus ferrooxidans]MCR1347213.1 hypothetical protein [Acidithiobacillus ferrooxidans]MCR1356038.1 hypothetical protein [Acidithiobacillus ferrooxidans]
MKGKHKRLGVLTAGLALLASGFVLFPIVTFIRFDMEAKNLSAIPYWVAILAWLTAPITTTIFAYFKNIPFRTIVKYSSFILIPQAAVVAMIYLSGIHYTGMAPFLAFLIVTIFPSIMMGYFAFRLADDLSEK